MMIITVVPVYIFGVENWLKKLVIAVKCSAKNDKIGGPMLNRIRPLIRTMLEI